MCSSRTHNVLISKFLIKELTMQMSHYYSIVTPLSLVSAQRVLYPNSSCLCKLQNFRGFMVMVENFRGLLLQTQRLRCHLANICAVTVLDVLTEAEDRHWGAVTTCLRAVEFNADFLWRHTVFLCLLLWFCDICEVLQEGEVCVTTKHLQMNNLGTLIYF